MNKHLFPNMIRYYSHESFENQKDLNLELKLLKYPTDMTIVK